MGRGCGVCSGLRRRGESVKVGVLERLGAAGALVGVEAQQAGQQVQAGGAQPRHFLQHTQDGALRFLGPGGFRWAGGWQ